MKKYDSQTSKERRKRGERSQNKSISGISEADADKSLSLAQNSKDRRKRGDR